MYKERISCLNLICFVSGGFVQAEHLSWCDKLAIDIGETVNGTRRWQAVANDDCILRESSRLVRNIITPGQFLHAASYAILAAVHHGLRINNEDSDSESDTSDSDRESDTSESD